MPARAPTRTTPSVPSASGASRTSSTSRPHDVRRLGARLLGVEGGGALVREAMRTKWAGKSAIGMDREEDEAEPAEPA